MSEVSKTKFSNLEKSINIIEIDADADTIKVTDSKGETIANYVNNNWDPVESHSGGSALVTTQINLDSWNQSLKQSVDNLSKEDLEKLASYKNKIDTENKTVAKNESKSGQNSGGDDDSKGSKFNLSNINVTDIPKDPEGFFIGRYPLNQQDSSNFDFLKITCYDYQSGLDLNATGRNLFKIKDIDKREKVRRGVVSLPMQPGISESNSVNWGEEGLNPFQVAGAQAAGEVMTKIADVVSGGGFNMQGIMETAGKTGGALATAVGEDAIKAFFAGQAIGANILTRGTGLTINNNLEVLFNGPVLRTFNYTYKFTPREPKEADKIKQIIRFFKKQMAPKRSNSRIFLKTPNVWKLKYTYKDGDPHPFLNNIKICALTGFNVDYTPDGSYSTYEDNGGRGDGSMTSYQVGLSFKEITPIYNDDFWNDDEGKEGTGF